MARIRSLKPEFWDDRKLAKSTTRDARMLYMGLWNQADEHCRLNGDHQWIKGRVFPFDDDLTVESIGGLIDELERAGRIQRYESEGDPYLFIPKLGKHQRLEPKVESRLPQPPPRPDYQDSAPHADLSASDADENALLYVAGSREQGAGGASAERDAPPPTPNCAKHLDGTEEPCGPCGTARRKYDAWVAGAPDRKRREVAARTSAINACRSCDTDGWLLNDLGDVSAFKCDHQQRRTG